MDFCNRPLGKLEQAWTINSLFSPLNAVTVFRLENGPPPEILRRALDILQARQPLLRAGVVRRSGQFHFAEPPDPPQIPLQTVPRRGDEPWRAAAETELAAGFPLGTVPLARCVYLHAADDPLRSELIFCCHHVIFDGASGNHLFAELLSLCVGLQRGADVGPVESLAALPPLEKLYPPAFKGWGRAWRTARFLLRMLAAEVRLQLASGPKYAVEPQARVHTLGLRLPPETTSALVRACRRRQVTVSNLLNAALLLAVVRHLLAGHTGRQRGYAFADLRPHLQPPLPAQNLGCYIAMMPYIVPVGPHSDVWALAGAVQAEIYRLTKRGDKFIAALLSKNLVEMFIRFKAVRMGAAALSYQPVRFAKRYGGIRLLNLHSFVTNNGIGPLFTGTARILFGALTCDLLAMDCDMDAATAQTVAAEIQEILETVSKL